MQEEVELEVNVIGGKKAAEKKYQESEERPRLNACLTQRRHENQS